MGYKDLINNKVAELQGKSKEIIDNDIFTELYHLINDRWHTDRVVRRLSYKYRLSDDDVYSIMLDKLYKTCLLFSDYSQSYYNFLSVSINNECKDILKKRYKQAERLYKSDVYSIDDDPHLVKNLPHANAADEELFEENKESEQRQLLTILFEKTDEKCRQALLAFSDSKSYVEAAKLLGISDKTVKARVERVAKHFNENEYGSIFDYFTVPTTPATSQRSSSVVA